MGDSILKKTNERLIEGNDVAFCLIGAKIEHFTERVD